MWLQILVGVAVILFVAVTWEFVPPPWAKVFLKIRDGSISVSKGRITVGLKDQLDEVVADEKLNRGWIALRSDQSIIFSRRLPPSVRQRIRNVIVNCEVD